MSGNAVSYGGGPIQRLYDSCGSDGDEGPYALCGFIYGDGDDRLSSLPPDDTLRVQVRGEEIYEDIRTNPCCLA